MEIESQPLIKTPASLTSSSALSSSPRKSTPLPKLTSESGAKSAEDTVRKKELHSSPSPPPPPPLPAFYNSAPRKDYPPRSYRESVQKKKLTGVTRNSPTKVWWSDPTKEDTRQDMNKNDGTSFVGSKATEEPEDKEDMITENDIHERNCLNISDVDKKADEFIAKFREQIRLQRIESIKRSAYKISANSSR
ncbi:hydroxyproline-rich glycoprotein family protein [Raphanus sativus]|nr:hydroxyproline-rich glycoprotein family protein [Raphanus sativus]